MPDKNNNEEFVRWILDSIPFEEIMTFMQQGNIMVEAMEYFNNDWCDYCDANPTEPEFPYEIQIWSQPQVYFQDAEGNDLDDWIDLSEGTKVTVLRKSMVLDDNLRLCIWGDKYFWLEIEEIRYGN